VPGCVKEEPLLPRMKGGAGHELLGLKHVCARAGRCRRRRRRRLLPTAPCSCRRVLVHQHHHVWRVRRTRA
jgi:hypothetical protein